MSARIIKFTIRQPNFSKSYIIFPVTLSYKSPVKSRLSCNNWNRY